MIHTPDSPLPSLNDDDLVYRISPKRKWIDPNNGRLLPDAFHRLSSRDPSGLSVFIAKHFRSLPLSDSDQSQILRNGIPEFNINKVYAISKLTVSSIRGLGLRVEPDRYNHANILDIPFIDTSQGEDLKRATYLADMLAELAEIVWVRPQSNPV